MGNDISTAQNILNKKYKYFIVPLLFILDLQTLYSKFLLCVQVFHCVKLTGAWAVKNKNKPIHKYRKLFKSVHITGV
jgi:hypothetical protein